MKNILHNLRNDLPASFVVFFVALPLCLGISLASGAPLFSGIIAGIVGGIIVGLLSNSQLGVSGPAAGLSTFTLLQISELGSYESFLVAVCLGGIIQIAMGSLKLGTIAYYFPSSVIKGMLFGIGVIIIIKQIPHALGYDSKNTRDFEEFIDQGALTTLQETLSNITPEAIIISVISFSIFIIWESFSNKKNKFFKALPAPLLVVFIGIIMSNFIGSKNLQIVQLPIFEGFSDFFSNFKSPNFESLKNPKIYGAAVTLALIASMETLLCVDATDKLDPQKRITSTNRELKAQGFGNLISGMIGGLPITQVIVRSSANISFGAKTKLSAIIHGFLLLVSVFAIPKILNMIPYASLACILLVVGYKLSHPKILYKVFRLGYEQFIPFAVSVIGIVFLDLLKGVLLGMLTAIAFILIHNFRNAYERIINKEDLNQHFIKLSEEVSFLNKGAIIQALNQIPDNSKLTIDGSNSKIIDYDVYEIIRDFQINSKTKNIELTLKGINFNKIN